jgi:hypothetical protein
MKILEVVCSTLADARSIVLDVINESQTGLLVDRRPMCAQRHFFAPRALAGI